MIISDRAARSAQNETGGWWRTLIASSTLIPCFLDEHLKKRDALWLIDTLGLSFLSDMQDILGEMIAFNSRHTSSRVLSMLKALQTCALNGVAKTDGAGTMVISNEETESLCINVPPLCLI